jgi:type II secretory pathway pseudopilin PulG
MDCKTTFTDRRRNPRRTRQAFTLVEGLIVMGLGSLLLIVVATMIFFSARSFAAMANYVDLENTSRNALDQMSREIRKTQELVSFTTNRLEFVDHEGKKLEYVFDPGDRTLTRIKSSGSVVEDRQLLLTECDMLEFEIFQRNPMAGAYDQYPSGSPATTKLVQLRWICSRQILGKKANTESIQTAKIVIRNQ